MNSEGASSVEGRARRNIARIVLVEDEPGDVYLLEKALSSRRINYELICFEDGEQAIQGLDTVIPDLILVDLNLPRRDGFDVLRTIRSRPALVDVPVGVFTSSEAPSDRSRASLIGAERYIHKPAELHEFVSTVGQAVEELLGGGRTDTRI
jgi:two-component system, chemotaxis family, response regulator Rcp1